MQEKDLRRAKHSMISAVKQQQRDLGVTTDTAVVERFVAPILDKMDRQALPAVNVPDVLAGSVGGATPRVSAPMTPGELMTKIVKALWSMPEWALKLNQARELCKAHYIGGVQAGCANCVRREDGFKNVIAQAYKVYGNPFRKKDRRIQVGRK